MGTGYTRQSAADIVDGLPITSAPLNAEFNKIKDAFDASTGHTHDGTSGNGAKVSLTTSVSGTLPVANGGTGGTTQAAARTGLGLGTISTQNANAVAITGGAVSGLTTLGASAAAITGGTITGTAVTATTLNTVSATITGGTISGTPISGSTVSGTSVTTANAQITGGSITGITDLTIADGGTGASTAAVARTNLGVAIGSDVQAYDAGLQSIAGLTTSANQIVYTTASDTYATTGLSAYGRTIINAADAAANKTLLALTKTDVGLANVDNTSDLTKPVSAKQSLLSGYRDKIINGKFDVWQRAATFPAFSTAQYTADRWLARPPTGGVWAVSRQGFGPTNNKSKFYFELSQTTAGSDDGYVETRIEDVRTFAGTQVTITWEAYAGASVAITPQIIQVFGTGGSPSATATASGASQTMTGGFIKYSTIINVPSILGKTLGSNGNDYMAVRFSLPGSSTYTFRLSRVSIVEGDATLEADPSPNRPMQVEEDLCKRYFQKSYDILEPIGVSAINSALRGRMFENNNASIMSSMGECKFEKQMRDIPSVSIYNPNTGVSGSIRDESTPANVTSATAGSISTKKFYVSWITPVALSKIIALHYAADAEL